MLLWCLLLQAVGEDGVRAQVDRLASPDVEVRQAAEAALVAMGEDAIPLIERLAAAGDLETRGRAADVLRRLRWWDHVVLWRGRRVDLRLGRASASDFGARARVVGGRILDVTPPGARAVDLRSNRELWKADLGLDREIWDVETGESSIVIRAPGGAACVDAATGRVLWRKDGWPRLAPVAGGDWVVADPRGVSRIGATSWTVKGAGDVSAAGPWVLVGDGRTTMILDAATGTGVRTLDGLGARRAVDAGEGRVLVVGERSLVAFRTSDGVRLWTRSEVQDASKLLVEGRRVYVADHMGMCCGIKLYALDLETGAPLWTAPARGIPTSHSKYRHDARLARVGAYLVLLGEASAGDYVEAFDPATGALVSRWTSN
jgi:hypothetical protein